MHYGFYYISIAIFFLSCFFYLISKKTIINTKIRVCYSILTFVFLLFVPLFVIANYFTGEGINQAVIYHIAYGLEGAGFAEEWRIILIGIFIIILIFLFTYWLYKPKKNTVNNIDKKTKIYICISFLLIFIASLINPVFQKIYPLFFSLKTKNKQSSDFRKYYRQPYIKKKSKKNYNLVFIYLESLERTYFDEKLFPNLIKGLKKLENQGTYFTNIEQVSNTGWTIGGVVASQCGIPLFTYSAGNSMNGMDKFLKNATCLSDLLSKKGYELTYMGGARLSFAGKGKFFSTHKFNTVLGFDELYRSLADKSYLINIGLWGLPDDILLNLAYNHFLKQSHLNNKFALFLLTLSTHHPKGHFAYKTCRGKGLLNHTNPMLNAVACSDYLIYNFVQKIRNSKYGDKTTIVIVSDHLAMSSNSAIKTLRKGNRKNVFIILEPNKNKKNKITKKGSTIDIAPTILSSIGYKGNIGLGRNLLEKKESLLSSMKDFNSHIKNWEQDVLDFWEFPKIKKQIEINVKKK